jgi:hypothetical protein
MPENGYAFEQIFCGLRMWWHESLGCKSSIAPDVDIDEALLAEGIWHEIDFADMYDELKEFFGFPRALDEWVDHFRLTSPTEDAPKFTFRALAEYIQARVEAVAMGPITILGKPCATAGVFRGLEGHVRQIDRNVERFGPSTPIRERLRGNALHQFCRKLHWVSLGRVPAPPVPSGIRLAIFVTLVGALMFAWFFARLDSVRFAILIGFLSPIFVFGCAALLESVFVLLPSPLPKQIVTFGDLARFLAEKPTTHA